MANTPLKGIKVLGLENTYTVAQPDWSQNDENASDYIKNRTHGMIPNKNRFNITQEMIENPLENIDGRFIKAYNSALNPSVEDLVGTTITTKNEAGEETVITTTADLILDCNTVAELGFLPIIVIDICDSASILFVSEECEFPMDETSSLPLTPGIWIMPYEGSSSVITNIQASPNMPKEVVYKLDEKYLPSNIQSDWNQNDENAIDYVKNRTHYTGINKNYFNITQEMIENPIDSRLNFEGNISAYKLSDVVLNPSVEDLVGTTITVKYKDNYVPIVITADQISDSRPDLPGITIAKQDLNIILLFALDDLDIPTETSSVNFTTGIWIWYLAELDENLVLTNIQSAKPEEIIHVLDEKYLPKTIVGKKVEGQSFTIDDETVEAQEGAEIFNDYLNNKATGTSSHAEGRETTASGDYSHAEGSGTKATGQSSHAEGSGTKATGTYSHAEGSGTQSIGNYSHAEGSGTRSIGNYSHAEGSFTEAGGYKQDENGNYLDINGNITTDKSKYVKIGDYSHAEGYSTGATGTSSHAEGRETTASGQNSHAEGISTKANGQNSHAEGYFTKANGQNSHAEGDNTQAIGNYSHAEGSGTRSIGNYSHAEGYFTKAGGYKKDSEGNYLDINGNITTDKSKYVIIGNYSHAEGNNTGATGTSSHAEGYSTTASGASSHAEGRETTASGDYSHAEGSGTKATGTYSHTEGRHTKAIGESSHAEGYFTEANGQNSHAEGYFTKAIGNYSHAEGDNTQAIGNYSHAEGLYTAATCDAQHVQGKYNKIDSDAAFIIGNGDGLGEQNRKNAMTVDWDGNGKFSGDVTTGNGNSIDGLANKLVDITTALDRIIAIQNELMGVTTSTITFTIDGKEHTALAGATWEEWIDSEYNTVGFYVDDTDTVVDQAGDIVATTDGEVQGCATEIVSGGSYCVL